LPIRNGDEAWAWIDRGAYATAEIFEGGEALVKFPSAVDGGGNGGGIRGEIMNQSTASRLRCAFALKTATCTWGYTSLLTFPRIPTDGFVAKVKEKLRYHFQSRWGEPVDAWAMEIQERGAPHFHLFHANESNFGIACSVASRIRVGSGDREREILRGGADWWLRDVWRRCLGGTYSDKAEAFMAGGMIEPIRSPDGAAKYVASEASKPHQKRLPEIYDGGLGRWWGMNPKWKGKAKWRVPLDLAHWPYDTPFKHVWDAEAIATGFTECPSSAIEGGWR